jgi:hypothetical protein
MPLLLKRQHVDTMNADMGGTEIYAGLENALDSQMRSIPTSLFLLTDGEVSKSTFPLDTNFDTDFVVTRCGDMKTYFLWSTVTSSKLEPRRVEDTSAFSLWELGTLRRLPCVKESHVREMGSA